MRRIAILACLATALLGAGCATVRYSDKGEKSMVEVANRGWYLLNIIPIASGDPEAPNENGCCLFRQTTTLANNMRMLDHAATERNAIGLKSVISSTEDESIFIILLKRHTIHTSAELVLPEDKSK